MSPAFQASTGPRSGERGVFSLYYFCGLRLTASTGPRSGERGVTLCDIAQSSHRPASTGPRSGERGVAAFRREIKEVASASTGPRSGERGVAVFKESKAFKARASTGPRSGERGVARRARRQRVRCWLQRGRAPESAEWNQLDVSRFPDSRLQRGRAPESAEWWTGTFQRRGSACFNGAALRRARSASRIPPWFRRPHRFNGAALRRARSGGVQSKPVGTLRTLQRGRAPESAEWGREGRQCTPQVSFNGAALRRARSAPSL